MTAPDGPCTSPRTWATPDRINGVSPGEVNLIRIVDVNGTRVVMTGALGPVEAKSPQAVARIAEVMGTVTFAPVAQGVALLPPRPSDRMPFASNIEGHPGPTDPYRTKAPN